MGGPARGTVVKANEDLPSSRIESSRCICVRGKAHPELQGADLIITYAANSMNDGTLAKDMSIYFLRFVRVHFSRK